MLTKIMTILGYRKQPKSKLDPDDFMAKLAQVAKSTGLPPGAVKIHAMPREDAERATPAGVGLPPTIPWEDYRKAMEEIAVPGWAYGIMGIGSTAGSTAYFIGNLRGDYGVFTIPTRICFQGDHYPGQDAEHEPILAQLVHLPTGVGIGVFETRQLACQAAELALFGHYFADNALIEPHIWVEKRPHLHGAWAFNGIVEDAGRHAHPLGNPHEIPIFVAAKLDAGRPEKLS